jgi:toxin CptA
MPAGLALAVALAAAALMGLAIQRGATCTVLAVNEVIEKRSAWRLLAMLEAAAWVAGGLVVARALGLMGHMPVGFTLTPWTIAGGLLLGLGAFVNGACVFGAIARLGSGEWAFLATPIGFWLGCLAFPAMSPAPGDAASPVLAAPAWAALPLAALAAWRLPGLCRRWSAHSATAAIGICFLVLLLLAGAWSYTDALAELAQGRAMALPHRLLLFLALMGGAVAGGCAAGRLRAVAPSPRQVARCAAGGALMAWGGLLVPGSNDGLILLGMPLLFAHAWAGFLAMAGAILAARLLRDAAAPSPRLHRPG